MRPITHGDLVDAGPVGEPAGQDLRPEQALRSGRDRAESAIRGEYRSALRGDQAVHQMHDEPPPNLGKPHDLVEVDRGDVETRTLAEDEQVLGLGRGEESVVRGVGSAGPGRGSEDRGPKDSQQRRQGERRAKATPQVRPCPEPGGAHHSVLSATAGLTRPAIRPGRKAIRLASRSVPGTRSERTTHEITG
jgi:hypothetical protein